MLLYSEVSLDGYVCLCVFVFVCVCVCVGVCALGIRSGGSSSSTHLLLDNMQNERYICSVHSVLQVFASHHFDLEIEICSICRKV